MSGSGVRASWSWRFSRSVGVGTPQHPLLGRSERQRYQNQRHREKMLLGVGEGEAMYSVLSTPVLAHLTLTCGL